MRRLVLSLAGIALALTATAAGGATAVAGTAAVVLPAPVLRYTFDTTTSGRVPDLSPKHLDGTFVGGDLGDALVPSLTGHAKALGLHGADHKYVDVPRSSALDVDRYTLSAWVNYTGVQNDATNGRWEVLEKANTYWLNVRTDGKVRAGGFYGGCGTPAWKYFDSTKPIPKNRWVHVASTYNGSKLTIYVDGKAAGSRAITGHTCVNAEPLAVAAKNAPAKGLLEAFWDGTLDDVRVDKQALTAAQVAQLARR